MLDGAIRRIIDPPLDAGGRALARRGVSANALTGLGLAFGLASALGVARGVDGAALACLLAGRLCDGLDGAVARATEKTARGGFLDIVADFVFYGAVPFAFALRAPEVNALPAAALLLAFYINGASFLAYAAAAAAQGWQTRIRGAKSLYFTAGLMEGAETILCFLAMILWPGAFPLIAWVFAALTLVTAAARVIQAWTTLP